MIANTLFSIPSHEAIDKGAMWADIQKTLTSIIENCLEGDSFETSYELIYKLCNMNEEKFLFDSLRDFFQTHLDVVASKISKVVGYDLLLSLAQDWSSFYKALKVTEGLFSYADRVYAIRYSSESLESSFSLGLKLFSAIVIENKSVTSNLSDAFLDFTIKERKEGYTICEKLIGGEDVELPFPQERLSVVRELIDFLKQIGSHIYNRILAKPFIKGVNQVIDELVSTANPSEMVPFLQLAERTVVAESIFVQALDIDQATAIQALHIIHNKFIDEHWDDLLSEQFNKIILNKQYHDAQRLLRLAIPVQKGVKKMCKAFCELYKTETMKTLKNVEVLTNKPTEAITEIILTRQFFSDYAERVFAAQKHPFVSGVNSVFSEQIAVVPIIAHLLSIFVDIHLSNPEVPEGGFGKVLSSVVDLCRFLPSPEAFIKLAQENLAKRLMMMSPPHYDAEASLVKQLNDVFGQALIYPLETMVQDSKQNIIDDTRLQTLIAAKKEQPVHLQVLTEVLWPFNPEGKAKEEIPELLKADAERVIKHYIGMKDTKRKKVFIRTDMGTVEGDWRGIADRVIKCTVPTHCAVVLGALGGTEVVPMKTIIEKTKLAESVVRSALEMLHESGIIYADGLDDEELDEEEDVRVAVMSGFAGDELKISGHMISKEKQKEIMEKLVKELEPKEKEDTGPEPSDLILSCLMRLVKFAPGKKIAATALVKLTQEEVSKYTKIDNIEIIKEKLENLILREFLKRNSLGHIEWGE
ncbi:Cullin like protein [Aduncisulcus paluster]|uniref:Cullin like protein n=1 Tax=Aduncisulcus paluster TaxID=2918883 RepID=A0ABQ5JU13_9EUKA|nr:Cullin like protein [Aduncisulcus paluster]